MSAYPFGHVARLGLSSRGELQSKLVAVEGGCSRGRLQSRQIAVSRLQFKRSQTSLSPVVIYTLHTVSQHHLLGFAVFRREEKGENF